MLTWKDIGLAPIVGPIIMLFFSISGNSNLKRGILYAGMA